MKAIFSLRFAGSFNASFVGDVPQRCDGRIALALFQAADIGTTYTNALGKLCL